MIMRRSSSHNRSYNYTSAKRRFWWMWLGGATFLVIKNLIYKTSIIDPSSCYHNSLYCFTTLRKLKELEGFQPLSHHY
jgi:hypothetical protein